MKTMKTVFLNAGDLREGVSTNKNLIQTRELAFFLIESTPYRFEGL